MNQQRDMASSHTENAIVEQDVTRPMLATWPHGTWSNVTLAGGRYQILSKLGEGGMGYVFRALDWNLKTDVVIKTPRVQQQGQKLIYDAFRQEVRSLVALTHPHIVRISDVGEYLRIPFAVMQYLAGGSLLDRLQQNLQEQRQPPPPHSLVQWLPTIAKALKFTHDKHYVHLDIKPPNILFDEYNNAFLGDFGLTQALSAVRQAGVVLPVTGTPGYVAPEVILGKEYDQRADVYGLAATIYHVLAGRLPYDNPGDGVALMVLQTTEPPLPLKELLPHVPAALSRLLTAGLAVDPNHRPSDCVEFAAQILSELSEQPVDWETPPAMPALKSHAPVPAFQFWATQDIASLLERVQQVAHELKLTVRQIDATSATLCQEIKGSFWQRLRVGTSLLAARLELIPRPETPNSTLVRLSFQGTGAAAAEQLPAFVVRIRQAIQQNLQLQDFLHDETLPLAEDTKSTALRLTRSVQLLLDPEEPNPRTLFCLTEKVAARGLTLICEAPLPPGRVQVRLPGDPTLNSGRIVHSLAHSDGRYRCGIVFDAEPKYQTEFLDAVRLKAD